MLSEVVTFEHERPSLLEASCASVGGDLACAPAARADARKAIRASSFEADESIVSPLDYPRRPDRHLPHRTCSDKRQMRVGLLWRREWDPPDGEGPNVAECKLRGVFAAFSAINVEAEP